MWEKGTKNPVVRVDQEETGDTNIEKSEGPTKGLNIHVLKGSLEKRTDTSGGTTRVGLQKIFLQIYDSKGLYIEVESGKRI